MSSAAPPAAPVAVNPPVFPLRTIRLGFALMVLMLSTLTLLTWTTGQQIRSLVSTQVRVLTATERVAHYGDVLELLIRDVVEDGDPAAAARYRQVQPELRRTLVELRRSIQLRENAATAARVDAADQALVGIEYDALALVEAGRFPEARAAIAAPRYDRLLRVYGDGIAQIQRRAAAYLASLEADMRRFLQVILGLSIASFVLVALAWGLLVRPMRAWGRQLDAVRIDAEGTSRDLVHQHAALETRNCELFDQARTDPLTGLATRLKLDEDLATMLADGAPGKRDYCAVMGDVDFFKQYNDRHGHLAGDEVLRCVARTLAAGCRGDDRIYRYGGEEFLVIMYGSGTEGARAGAERYRAAVESLGLPHPDSAAGVVTISMGMAVLRDADLTAWLAAADAALYVAKRSGRNRVAVHPGGAT